eukprot:NODE_22_length_38364_cov_0.248661.p14 type:complete len:255 gc:universal NODE_22_length_38364_cov_0.248661:15193-14429(-)
MWFLKKRYILIPLCLYGAIVYTKTKLKSELLATNYEANISRRYKHFKQDSQFTIDQLLSMMTIDDIDLELYLQSLSQFKNSQQVLIDGNYVDKLTAWKLFKSKCMEKLFIKLYATCALSLLVHVQMNIIGKYTYLQSVGELNDSKIKFTDKKSQNVFLEKSQFVFEEGWKNLNIQNALKRVDDLELNQAVSIKDLHKLIQEMRESIEVHQNIYEFKQIILPSREKLNELKDDSIVNIHQLNNELYDVIDRWLTY